MKRTILIAAIAAILGAVIAVAVMRARSGAEAEAEEAPAAPSRVTVENGEPTITLPVEDQRKLGIVTSQLMRATNVEEAQVFGNVLDVRELADLQNQVSAARAQSQQVASKLAFDRAEYERLRVLNADNKNVSDKAVQEAAAALSADTSQIAASNVAIQAAQATAVQRFGPVLGSALTSQSDLYRSLLTMRTVLVQISFPGTPPRTIAIDAGDGTQVTATLVSDAPRVDPRLQGKSYFFVAPAGKLSAGMNVSAHYTGTRAVDGVVIPRDAIVSWQGRSWVYVRRAPTKFARRELASDTTLPAGVFVTGLGDATEVVTTGAQQLLSEEMRSLLHEE